MAAAPPAPEVEVGWPSDEIVTEPGWPMPGEVDVPWSSPAAEPVGAGVGPEPAYNSWSEQAATSAPPADLQWASPEPEVEDIPQWAPPAEPLAEEIPQWTPPEQTAAPAPPPPVEDEPVAWDAPAEEPVPVASPSPRWLTDEAPADDEDSQVTGPIPVIREAPPVDEAAFDLPDEPFPSATPDAEIAVAAVEEAFEAPPVPEADEALEMDFPAFEDEAPAPRSWRTSRRSRRPSPTRPPRSTGGTPPWRSRRRRSRRRSRSQRRSSRSRPPRRRTRAGRGRGP